jgi:hypothetical protein
MTPTVILGWLFTDPIILVLRPFFKTFFQAFHPFLSPAGRGMGEGTHL